MSNKFGKTVAIDKPYAVFEGSGFTWHILKTYKLPKNEKNDAYARWFVAAKSPFTYGEWEYGDTYVSEILDFGKRTSATQNWVEAYDHE